MAEYSFNPQFANLTGLQPVPAIDVTRGANLQFRPLDKIEIMSSQPELIAQSLAGAVTNIAKGALGGITANFEKKEEEEREKRKFAHEAMLYGVKEKSENADFFAKEEARWISENVGKPGFAGNLSKFRAAQSRLKDTVPDRPQKQDEVVEPPLPELEADFVTPPEEIPQEPALSAIPVSTTSQALANVPVPEQAVQPEQKVEEKPLSQIGKSVDYTEYEQPQTPNLKFESQSDAQNAVSELNKTSKNPDWKFEVKEGKDEWGNREFVPVPVSVRESRINREQKAVELSFKQQEAEQKAEKSEQDLQLKKQKIKDEDRVWASQVEEAATSLQLLNDAISIIEKNPNYSVGKSSAAIARVPMIDTDASRIRQKLIGVEGVAAIKALTAMRLASPTGAAVGNVSDKDMQIFKTSEGSIDPDTQTAEDILPVLRNMYRKRLEIFNDSVNVLKQKNPEYTPPPIEFPKEQKKKPSKTKSAEEMVSVISPDGKSGKIPRSQLEAAIAEGYKAQ